jgi:hypothetical protein
MDHDILSRAQKYADQKWPLPSDTPTSAAVRTGLLTLVLLVFFSRLEHWLGFSMALILGIAVATGSVFFEKNQRWNNHSRALEEAVERLERDKKR